MENNYNKLSDEEFQQLTEEGKIIYKDLDIESALRIIKLCPDNAHHAYEKLNDIITKNKREIAVIEVRKLEKLKENNPDCYDFYFSSLFGKRFTGVSITEDNDLNLYFTDGSRIFMIKIDFLYEKVSMSAINPILNFDDVPEEHLTTNPVKLHVIPVELFGN